LSYLDYTKETYISIDERAPIIGGMYDYFRGKGALIYLRRV